MTTNAAALLDKAKKGISAGSFTELATTLGVSRQQVSRWKTGIDAVPDDRLRQLARMAHEDYDKWVLLLEADRSTGDRKRAWERLASRLGVAAALALAIMLPALPARASMNDGPSIHYAKL